MSFFGFDVTLPRDRPARASEPSRGLGDEFDPTFDPTYTGDDVEEDEDLDAKINALTAGAQEDVAVYTWGEEDYDGLGDRLEEDGDDLNEDTFGVGDVGTDFNFGHDPEPQQPAAGAAGQQAAPLQPSLSKFDSSLDDFMTLDTKRRAAKAAGAVPSPAPTAPPAARPAPKTMEEIEAELRASRISQPPQQQQQPSQVASPLPPPGRRPLTMEELEAQMRQSKPAQSAGPVPQQLPPQNLPPPSGPMNAPLPPNFAAIMAQQQQQQQQQQRQQQLPGAPPRQGTPVGPGQGSVPPAAVAMQAVARAQAEAQAAHFARMKALLESMPQPVQQSILSLPPALQFESLEKVVEQFPALRTSPSDEGLINAAVTYVRESAMRKIEELKVQEAKIQRRMAKIQAMSRYNGLMSRYDQDFITKIQVSQLVTQDPYTDDFYAHIYFALRGGRGPSAPVLGQGSDRPKEAGRNGKKQPRLSKRENAMLRMQQGVERIVKHRMEKAEKTSNGVALEGALGKITASSTKGMKQMLSLPAERPVRSAAQNAQGAQHAVLAALAGASLGQDSGPGKRRPALGKHEVLRILERLYDTVLALEQLRRNAGDQAEEQDRLTETLWKELRVLEPLDISDPHPFVSLLSTAKGKRLLPRILRHLSPEQTLTTMTMIVASFDSLDVVKNAHLLDGETPGALAEQREDAERQTEAFANSVVPSMMTLIANAPMKIVSGMLAVFIERNDPVKVARSRPGVAFLTIFLSRAESLRQGGIPSAEDLDQWSQIFALLFQRLSAPGMLPSLFPSTRAKAKLPFGPGYYMSGAFGAATAADVGQNGSKLRNIDIEDEPVWNLMAAVAVACSMEQQQTLVASLRDKILENVMSAKEWANRRRARLTDEFAAAGFEVSLPGTDLGPDVRIRNVNLLLHALNLDATQIAI